MVESVIISGANGFIGRHLADYLRSKNLSVYTIFKDQKDIILNKSNPIICNLVEDKIEDKLPKNIDTFIHLAQSRNYRHFPNYADEIYKVNVYSTFKVLEWCRKNSVNRFVFTSTGSVYGQNKVVADETLSPNPHNFYAASKLNAELLARQYEQFFNVNILRLFTVYGPGQKDNVMSNLLMKVKLDENIQLARGVGAYLTPIYISDLTNIIHKLLSFSINPKDPINICSNTKVGLNEVVDLIGKKLNKKVNITKTEEVINNATGDNSLLKKYIGHFDFYDLSHGIDSMIEGSIVSFDRPHK